MAWWTRNNCFQQYFHLYAALFWSYWCSSVFKPSCTNPSKLLQALYCLQSNLEIVGSIVLQTCMYYYYALAAIYRWYNLRKVKTIQKQWHGKTLVLASNGGVLRFRETGRNPVFGIYHINVVAKRKSFHGCQLFGQRSCNVELGRKYLNSIRLGYSRWWL